MYTSHICVDNDILTLMELTQMSKSCIQTFRILVTTFIRSIILCYPVHRIVSGGALRSNNNDTIRDLPDDKILESIYFYFILK